MRLHCAKPPTARHASPATAAGTSQLICPAEAAPKIRPSPAGPPAPESTAPPASGSVPAPWPPMRPNPLYWKTISHTELCTEPSM